MSDSTKRDEAQGTSSRWLVGVVTSILVGAGAIAVAATSSDEDTATTSSTAPTSRPPGDPISPSGPGPTFPAGPPAEQLLPEPGASIDGATPCPAEDGSSPRTTNFAGPPPMCIDPAARYTAIVDTTNGPLRISLNQGVSPEAVNNFVVLALYHYYDDSPIHLVAPRAIVQGGDPVGNPVGTGDPGYLIPSEVKKETPPVYITLSVAAVAMPPDYSQVGSQFFVVAGDEATALDPVHPVIGLLMDGMETVRSIEAIGNPETLRPTEDVRIESVTILKS